MEIRAMELAKEDMAKEIGKLTRQADELHQLQDEMKDLKTLYVETEQKYQTMLTVDLYLFYLLNLVVEKFGSIWDSLFTSIKVMNYCLLKNLDLCFQQRGREA